MVKTMNEKYNKLRDFWDSNLILTDEEKEKYRLELKNEDYKEMAPSEKLYYALCKLKGNVLDYGCGSGWASIILAKNGLETTSVDVSRNGIDALKFYSEVFKVKDKIKSFTIDENWLSKEEDNKYDGIFSSNVLDVVPLEMSLEMIKEFSRICKKGGKVIIGMNFYLDPVIAKERKMELNSDNELYVNGVLRLLNKSSEEWKEEFSKYFKVEKLEYFSWPGEQKETRRIFYLEK